MDADATLDAVHAADALRTPENATDPDPRCLSFSALDDAGIRQWTLHDQHDAIRKVELNASVPHSVRVHFETAKNIYLYSWFVYRFFPIAEQQALISLEFALRERLATIDPNALAATKVAGPRGLGLYLKQVRALGLIRNEELQVAKQSALGQARKRYEMEVLQRMSDLGLDEMVLNDADVQVRNEDYSVDWISLFAESFPVTRNSYAHGSKILHPSVIRTFEIIAELINQLFPSSECA